MAKSENKKKSISKLNKRELTAMVSDFLSEHADKAIPVKQVFRALKLTSHPMKMMCMDVLNEMAESGMISRNGVGEISVHADQRQVLEGVYVRKQSRGYVDTDDDMHVIVYDENSHHALNGDRVKVALLAKRRGSNKLIGEVLEIVSRSEKPFIGTLQVGNGMAFLVTPEWYCAQDIFIPADKLKGGKDGEKAVVKIIEWPEKAKSPIGEVVDVLGPEGDNNTEMHAILAEYGLPYSYPEHVERAADAIPAEISQEELDKREDFRGTTTFTIDPKDAKDFDDALSIKKLDDNLWEVGVHIADVSHYVTKGSVIDEEAYNRATSVYLVDRTVPMLPERLCNFICSLRPDEEKLTFSAVFDMDENANVKSSRIVHTVIKSDRRFAYEEVQEILEKNGEARDVEEAVPVEPEKRQGEFCNELITLNRFAHILRDKRMKEGAIDFDREEVRFDIDEQGKPTGVYFKRSKDANKLIEEFMLLANRTVAESVGKVKKGEKAKTLPYRIHDTPDPAKLENLGTFVTRFGLKLNTYGTKEDVAKNLNTLLREVRGKKMQEIVEDVSLRAMMKAKYSTYNIGHYGLAFDYYTHFTSPIRRYPDLMVHRLLTKYAEGAKSAEQKKYEEFCEHCSEMEQLAANAERSSIKYKQVEFLSDKIGQEFDATVSSVTEFGVYAEIDQYKCEGLIPVRSLGNEAFDFDDRNFALVGRKTHKVFTLGDKLKIKIVRTDLYRKQVDFDLVDKEENSSDTTAPKPFYMGLAADKQTAKSSKKTKKAKKTKVKTRSRKKK